MKSLLSCAIILCLAPTLVAAERYICNFPESGFQLPTDITFVLSEFSDRALVDDSVRRPLDRGRQFAKIDSNTDDRLRLTWRFENVPRSMLQKIDNRLSERFVDYQLTIQKSDMRAVVVATYYMIIAQPMPTRAHGRCQRLGE